MNRRNLRKMHAEDFEQFQKITGGLTAICPAIEDALEAYDIDLVLSKDDIRILTSSLYRLSKFGQFVDDVSDRLRNQGIESSRAMEEQYHAAQRSPATWHESQGLDFSGDSGRYDPEFDCE